MIRKSRQVANMRNLSLKRKAGMTLTETLIASFILVLGMTAISRLVTSLTSASVQSGRMTAATEVAQEKMEEMLATRHQDLESGSDQPAPFERSWTVTEHEEGYKSIVVEVSWTDSLGITRDMTLDSVVTEIISSYTGSQRFDNIPSLGP